MSRIIGQRRGVTIPAQSIYEESSTQKHPLGERLVLGDRVFRYAKEGGSGLTKAYMTAGPAIVANHKEVVQTAYGISAGADEVQVLLTGTDPTAGQYRDGYLVVNKGTGIGQAYKIKSHDTNYDPLAIVLYDPVETAIAATAECTLVPSVHRDVVVFPTTAAAPAAGVPLLDITADYYCWLQVKGPCPLIVDTGDTLVAGEKVGFPTTPAVAGACGTPAVTDQGWGVAWYVATAGEAALVYLNGLGLS